MCTLQQRWSRGTCTPSTATCKINENREFSSVSFQQVVLLQRRSQPFRDSNSLCESQCMEWLVRWHRGYPGGHGKIIDSTHTKHVKRYHILHRTWTVCKAMIPPKSFTQGINLIRHACICTYTRAKTRHFAEQRFSLFERVIQNHSFVDLFDIKKNLLASKFCHAVVEFLWCLRIQTRSIAACYRTISQVKKRVKYLKSLSFTEWILVLFYHS